MRSNSDIYEIISKRSLIISIIELLCFIGLIIRLGYLQIFKFNDFRVLSDKNRIRVLPIIPGRGKILDCNGREIVYNKHVYKLILDKEYKSNIKSVYAKISKILPYKTIMPIDKNEKLFQIVLMDDLTWDEIAKLSISVSNMPGISIEKYIERKCDDIEAFSHIVGYTADDSDFNVLGYKKGVIGIEYEMNDILKGSLGQKSVEVNVIGKPIRELQVSIPSYGEDISLSINYDLQKYIYEAFKEYKAGACVVIDIFTGEIKAMVSYPGYDCYNFSQENWKALNNNDLKPLNNRAISCLYPPGSVFKLITAVALLESNIRSDYSVQCNHVYKLGNHDFHCWKKGGHGLVNLERAISESCDIFFYHAAKNVGINRIEYYAKLFGLGQKTGIEFSNEVSGLIPGIEWKKNVFKKPWYPYETILTAIGQGSVLTTPLQLAVITAMIANGGFKIKPTILKVKDLDLLERINVSEANLNIISKCMFNVCNRAFGTAYWSLIRQMKVTPISGKTGTSQVVAITKLEREDGSYKNFQNKDWEQRDHALFVGYAPVIAPKYAVAVILEHEVSGSKYAAPFAAKVLQEVLRLDKESNLAQVN